MKQIDPKQIRSLRSNPIVWGGVGLILAVVAATVAEAFGKPLPQSTTTAAAGGFFWAWLVCILKNKQAAKRK